VTTPQALSFLRFAGVRRTPGVIAPAAAVAAFAVLFASPFAALAQDWWSDPDAGHGLLLGPLALVLIWRNPPASPHRPARALGLLILVAAVILRYVAGLAVELFTLRVSMLVALAGLVIFYFGIRQLLAWWLPFTILALAIPIPDLVLAEIALPLQLQASRLGAALLDARHVPVRLAGNIILLPGRELFVTEACSGLRSLTALLATGVLLGGVLLRQLWGRLLLVAAAVPIAIAINALRVFLTGYLVHFVGPEAGEGMLHLTEGWLLFGVSFAALAALAGLAGFAERRTRRQP
jgi:exosortase